MKLEKELLTKTFSHIYVENEAYNYPLAQKILSQFKNSQIIKIDNYKEIFSRNNQNFELQKLTPKLILAVKKDNFLYKGATVCDNFGNKNFYYISSVLNCLYDCEYCYLQGVYSSANMVIFVNIEDMFREVVDKLNILKKVYICISYDTDILALENILHLGKMWYDFAKKNKNVSIELRTKSNNILNLPPLDNFILAWTLSPNFVVQKYENKTPNLDARINAIKRAINLGWKIRLCFDPIIKVGDKNIYAEMINEIFSNISKKDIFDISVGSFRISKEYIKRIKKNRPTSEILHYPFICEDGVYRYDENFESFVWEEIYKRMKGKI